MSLDELVSEAKLRIQRHWPAMMILDKRMEITRPGEPPTVVKEIHILASRDVDAGFQLLAVVAASFGSADEHSVIAKSRDELMSVGQGL